jgi:hypothetical protein
MTKLNEREYGYAQRLVADRNVVLDGRDDWSEHQPSEQDENRFIRDHGMDEYARWHLGIDEGQPAADRAVRCAASRRWRRDARHRPRYGTLCMRRTPARRWRR